MKDAEDDDDTDDDDDDCEDSDGKFVSAVKPGPLIFPDDDELEVESRKEILEPRLEPLQQFMWECDMIVKLGIAKQASEEWQCKWCKTIFQKWNGTKAMRHVVGKGEGIQYCVKKIKPEYKKHCIEFYNKKVQKKIEQDTIVSIYKNQLATDKTRWRQH